MDIEELLNPYVDLFPYKTLVQKVNSLLEYLPEGISDILPNISIGNDGLMLKSLIIITNNYLAELRLDAHHKLDVDILAKDTVYNYRINAWKHEIKKEDAVINNFELAKVVFIHGDSGGSFITEIAFAGDEKGRDNWLKRVTQAIPIDLVLNYSRSKPINS